MLTPQEIENISFEKATFGGYNMQSVDELLEPLTEDYITLYKENALLKSKMKVLVAKLEEYRNNEDSMKDAIVNAQKTCDLMVKEAEAKCTQLLNDANAAAIENAKHADEQIAAEEARVENARRTASQKIDSLKEQLVSCVKALDRIKESHRPVRPAGVFDYDQVESTTADAVADEISANIEAIVGTTNDSAPIPQAKHPTSETTTKFSNLQFGRNYDPTARK